MRGVSTLQKDDRFLEMAFMGNHFFVTQFTQLGSSNDTVVNIFDLSSVCFRKTTKRPYNNLGSAKASSVDFRRSWLTGQYMTKREFIDALVASTVIACWWESAMFPLPRKIVQSHFKMSPRRTFRCGYYFISQSSPWNLQPLLMHLIYTSGQE